jgi:hypothetical protein
MGHVSIKKSDFSAGELAPTLIDRSDINQYRSGAAKMRNVLALPHGGFKRCPGLLHHAQLKYAKAVRKAPAAATNATQIHFIPELSGTTNVKVAYWVGTDTTEDASACFLVDASGAIAVGGPAYFISIASGWIQNNLPGGVARLTDRIHITVENSADQVACVYDTAVPDLVNDLIAHQGRYCKFLEVEFNTEQIYLYVFTAYRVEIFQKVGDYYVSQAYEATIYRGQDVEDLTFAHSLDTVVSFHKAYPPMATIRSATGYSHRRFGTLIGANLVLSYGPQYDYNDANSPATGVDHVETINFINDGGAMWADANEFTIIVGGEETQAIEFNTTPATLITNLYTGIEALSTVSVGDVTVAWDVDNKYTITMSGDSGDQFWEFKAGVRDFSSTGQYVTLITTTKGQGKLEDAWSAPYRGYPRCGTFFQNRLFCGGSLSLPNAIWGSRSGNIYDFNSTETLADYAIFYFIGSNTVSTVHAMYPGRHFLIYTSDAEYYVPVSFDEGLTPENFFIRKSTEKGSTLGQRPFDIGGAMLTVGRYASTVNEFFYEESQQSYTSGSLSKLSPHLLNDIRDVSFHKAQNVEEADYIHIVNADGSLAILNTLRGDNVNAWTLRTTRGAFWNSAEVGTDSLFSVWRNALDADGNPTATSTLHLESFDNELFVDSAVKIGDYTTEGGTNAAVFTIDHLLTGETVQIVVGSNDLYRYQGDVVTSDSGGTNDGNVWSIFDVIEKDGVGTNVYDDYQAGLEFPIVHGTEDTVWVQLLPYETGPEANSVRGDATSIYEAVLRVYQSMHCRVSVNDGDQYEAITIKSNTTVLPNSVADLFASTNWFTGIKDIEGLRNWDESSMLNITQRKPLPLTVLGVTYKVNM